MQVTVPNLKPEAAGMPPLPILDLPLIEGTAESLAGYGEIVSDPERYFGRQGRVHARVSANFPNEFGCYLGAPLIRESAL
jgi:hypothetical protein